MLFSTLKKNKGTLWVRERRKHPKIQKLCYQLWEMGRQIKRHSIELSDLHKVDRVCALTCVLKMETLVHEREAHTHTSK